ncbi:PAS domain S-box-containing protein [Fontibacillus panacisegetis]|uniref:histidine kinase n=1 Tax=Fontibacillus panacisegetis TaxID=670482 RepID=A0A1G7UHS8_9BACL|nr:ATP-binding protein [Fontibacillus panacisegetis]SDG46619.1 PAS domain S-box-containing protein [Fontibacillus panacisegetis]
MSIKKKLSLIMSVFALTLLSINILLSYFSTRDNLREESEANMMLTAKQIALAVEQSRSVYDYIKRESREGSNQAYIEHTLKMTSPERITQESIRSNNSLLEISGVNPLNKQSSQFLLFGTYEFKSEDLLLMAKRALDSETSFLHDTIINGERVLESFVPIEPYNQEPYVIRIISSYEPISTAISQQLLSQVLISVVLLFIVISASYILAGEVIRPIQDILKKVNQLSSGDFNTRLKIDRNDELGSLALQINTMAESLGRYTMELKQKNEENRSVNEHLESIINGTADAIHVTDAKGKILRVNSAFEDLYGWNVEEIVGSKLDFVPPFKAEEGFEWRSEQELEQGRSFVLAETVRLRKDGAQVNVSISESPIYNEEGQIAAFITISRDMTEHNKMEDLLRRSEKLTTVGRLAAGVAHEIRNPLTTLRGFLQMQQSMKMVNEMHTDIMLSELDRINLIVSEFLILAKPQAVHFEVKDVRFTLGDVISLLDSEAHLHNIEFQVYFSQAPILIHCEENQLKQVFINVLKNAMEAMPSGGMIKLLVEEEDRQAVIRVIDQGEGISKERLKKLGEPFYTNKEKGTGLGLMVSQRIIEVHKGLLEFESELGKGTIVTVTLPKVTAVIKSDDVLTEGA